MLNFEYTGVTITEATRTQELLKQRINLDGLDKPIRVIAGADISFNKFSPVVYAGIVLLSYPDMVLMARSLVRTETHFPYVPGFLAFREAPALLQAWEQLPLKPDVLVVDGHGIAHPRSMGIAAHFGVLTEHACLGCAKKLLYGHYQEPAPERGASSILYSKTDEAIGWVIRTKEKVKPVFVSPGNKMSLDDSRNIIMQCLGRYRIPEPTRLAHEAVNLFRTGRFEAGYHQVAPPLF